MEAATRKQYAALPYRMFDDQGLKVMLITSRGTGRWVVPKGWPMSGIKPWRAAAREAYEEAGIVGNIEKRAAGRYDYEKRLNDGTVAVCEVEVFPMRVEEELPRWPEQQQRTRRWFSPEEAALLVDEKGLQTLLAEILRVRSLDHVQAGQEDPGIGSAPPDAPETSESRVGKLQNMGNLLMDVLTGRKAGKTRH